MSDSSDFSSSPIEFFPIKDPSESLAFGLDFSPMMAFYQDSVAALLLVSATPVFIPQGVVPGALSISAQGQNGNLVSCLVGPGGSPEVNYRLSFKISTVNGYVYERSGILSINYR